MVLLHRVRRPVALRQYAMKKILARTCRVVVAAKNTLQICVAVQESLSAFV
jgi:hypothetical protein